jgi:hypothetical protein
MSDTLDDDLTPFDRIVKESDERVEDSSAVLAAVTELELELDLELRRCPSSTTTNIPLEYQLRSPSRLEYQHPLAPNSRTSTQTSAQSHAGRSAISSFQSGVPAAQLDTPVFYTHKNLNIEEISSSLEPQREGLS